MKAALRLLHLVSLDNVGGVERNFSELIGCVPGQGIAVEHLALVPRLPVAAPIREAVMRHCRAVWCPRYVGPVKLPNRPRRVRAVWQTQLVKRARADKIILWNRLDGFDLEAFRATGAELVYYERSRAWFSRDHDVERRTLLGVHKIICNSQASRRVLQLKYDLPDTVQPLVCLNAVRPSCMPSACLPRALAFPLVLGIACRFTAIKGVASALHAVAELGRRGIDVRLLLAGQGPELERLRDLARRLDVADRVEFLGTVADMPAFFRRIHVLLAPSLRESFGLGAAEALAAGVPVVAAEVDGLAEVVRDGVTGRLVEPRLDLVDYAQLGGDVPDPWQWSYRPRRDALLPLQAVTPADLADAVAWIAGRSDTDYVALCEAAHRDARQRFDYARHVARLYELLLQPPPSRG